MQTRETDKAGQLDAEELLFLALRSMEKDEDDEAIQYLKRGLALEPESGILHHLLGAMYAQLGMVDRGIDELKLATHFNPQLHMARFQLGLLHFTATDLAAADDAWRPLGELAEDHALRLFRDGLLQMGQDRFADAVATLRRGLDANNDYESLNADMEMMVEMCEKVVAEENTGQSAQPVSVPPVPAAPPPAPGRHVLLSGYQGAGDTRKPLKS